MGSACLNHCPHKESHTDFHCWAGGIRQMSGLFRVSFVLWLKRIASVWEPTFIIQHPGKNRTLMTFAYSGFLVYTPGRDKKLSHEFKAWLCKCLPKQKTKWDQGGMDRAFWKGSNSNPRMGSALLPTPEPASYPAWPACFLSIELRFSLETTTTKQKPNQQQQQKPGPRVLEFFLLSLSGSLLRSKTFHPQWAGSGS